jgi:hypothetical protein
MGIQNKNNNLVIYDKNHPVQDIDPIIIVVPFRFWNTTVPALRSLFLGFKQKNLPFADVSKIVK